MMNPYSCHLLARLKVEVEFLKQVFIYYTCIYISVYISMMHPYGCLTGWVNPSPDSKLKSSSSIGYTYIHNIYI